MLCAPPSLDYESCWSCSQCSIQSLVCPFPIFWSLTVTGSTYVAKVMLFLLFGSICAAVIKNSKNKPQFSFMKLKSVLIIVSNHVLNSFGVRPFLLSHSIAAYGTTASLRNLSVVMFVMPVVSHMA